MTSVSLNLQSAQKVHIKTFNFCLLLYLGLSQPKLC